MDSGNQLLIYDASDSSINCYSLATPYVVSGAVFVEKCAVVGEVVEMWVDATGTTAFFLRNTSSIGSVNVYKMSTAHDISTIAYHSRISIGDGYWKGLYVSTNGFHLYVGSSSGYIKHIYMHEPLDLGYVTLLETVDVSNADSIDGLVINPAGTRLYVTDNPGGRLYQYALGTAYYMTDHTYEDLSLNISGLGIVSLYIEDASYADMLGVIDDKIYRYRITLEDWSFSNFDDFIFDGVQLSTDIWSFHVSPDGVNLYTMSLDDTNCKQFVMSTPYDLSTASYVGQYDYEDGNRRCINISADGVYLYVLNTASTKIQSHTMLTPFDITTASVGPLGIAITGNNTGFEISDDGTILWCSIYDEEKFAEYSLITPFDVSSAVFVKDISVTTTSASISLDVNNIGTEAVFGYASPGGDPFAEHFTLSTPFDLSTRVLTGTFVVDNTYDICCASNYFYSCIYGTSTISRYQDGSEFPLDWYANGQFVDTPSSIAYNTATNASIEITFITTDTAFCLSGRADSGAYPIGVVRDGYVGDQVSAIYGTSWTGTLDGTTDITAITPHILSNIVQDGLVHTIRYDGLDLTYLTARKLRFASAGGTTYPLDGFMYDIKLDVNGDGNWDHHWKLDSIDQVTDQIGSDNLEPIGALIYERNGQR